MRNVYYQSVGNPLQADRLPATRPTIEFATETLECTAWMSVLQVSGIATIIGAVMLLVYRAPGFAILDPYDLLIAVPVIVTGLAISISTRSLNHILHPAVLVAMGVVSLNHRMPWTLQALMMAIGSGLLVYQFGQHAVAMITTRPMRRAETAAARAAASATLLILAGLTTIVVAAALWSSVKILIVAAWTLPVCMLCAPAPAGLNVPRWKMWLQSLQSWCSYSPSTLPGLLQSPAGSLVHRMAMLFLAAQLTGIALVRWDGSPLPDVFAVGAEHHATMNAELDAANAGRLERVKHGAVTWFTTFAAMAALPVVIPVFLATAMITPVLCEAALAASRARGRNVTQSVIADIHTSPDRIEQKSIYMGRVVADGTPVLVPFKVFTEHAHGLGDSGSGKTSLFLCPLIEQLVMSGECSVIVIDLKADSLELLATQIAAAERLRAERGISIPVKCFSNQADRSTFAFNPMTQPFWDKFDLLTQTDILCGANGLTYGTDYGAGYFSSANAAVLYHAIKSFPHVRTFQELADCIGTVITTAKKQDLHPEICKAGVHVQEVIKRLANCHALNVTDATGHDPQVVEQAIDLTKPFLEPQLLYFHLSATLSPSGAPEIGRLVNYMLLAASTQTERKHPVFLVIDEFQRMVASNLEYMLQLARSMGVGVILANQSMEDLKKSSVNLIPPIEANCRLRQWFSVSASEDRERLIQSSGETVDIDFGRKTDVKTDGQVRHSYSESERVVPRITINDVLLTSDHPFRSVLKLRTGDGYAQFGGFPVIVESEYHITEAEYQRRRAMPWPSLPGMLLPGSQRPVAPPKSPSGPKISQEVIGAGESLPTGLTPDAVDEFLTGLKQSFESPKPRRKKEKPS